MRDELCFDAIWLARKPKFIDMLLIQDESLSKVLRVILLYLLTYTYRLISIELKRSADKDMQSVWKGRGTHLAGGKSALSWIPRGVHVYGDFSVTPATMPKDTACPTMDAWERFSFHLFSETFLCQYADLAAKVHPFWLEGGQVNETQREEEQEEMWLLRMECQQGSQRLGH